MIKRKLEKLFRPEKVAIIGASKNETRLGHLVFQNIHRGEFKGELFPVNPKEKYFDDLKSFSDVKKVPVQIDLAIVVVPDNRLVQVIEECFDADVESILVISGQRTFSFPQRVIDQISKLSARHKTPIIGLGSYGLICPRINLNASLAQAMPRSGSIAFISQSKSVSSAVLDWSRWKGIGFSYFISFGTMLDVSFSELIDYFGTDPYTKSILIYMESIRDARAFMSAARAFSRNKPIIILKAGKTQVGKELILQHTGHFSGEYAVYRAAFQRAGVIPVWTIEQLFDCALAFSSQPNPKGNTLGIITNTGGPGILAADYLTRSEGRLPNLGLEVHQKLQEIIPGGNWEGGLIELPYDTPAEIYTKVLHLLQVSSEVDGILIIHSPQFGISPLEVAQVIAQKRRVADKPVFTAWMGYEAVEASWEVFAQKRIPVYRFPESAVDTFLRMYRYAHNIQLQYETPPTVPQGFSPPKNKIKAIFQNLQSQKRKALNENEVVEVLTYYNIPVEPDHQARPNRIPLLIGSRKHQIMGPTLYFGLGGPASNIYNDISFGIPPLNLALAKQQIAQTKIFKLIEKYKREGEDPIDELALFLYKFSYLIADFPELMEAELRIALYLEGRCLVERAKIDLYEQTNIQNALPEYNRLIISPYPEEYTKKTKLKDGQEISLRAIRPEDEPLELEMIKKFSKQSIYYRFFGFINHFTHEFMTRFTHIDYDREIAIIAEIKEPGHHEMIGVVRLVTDIYHEKAEYAIAIPDHWQGFGLGNILTDYILEIARARKIKKVVATVLKENSGMVHIFKKRGFTFKEGEEFRAFIVELDLSQD